ncbi:hypothetical protein JKF63_02692 [Porcisia hertigi]|uniref:Uncharacterized protein n=1 Tax=Porcisia hertigi TaxID=2761500 RepID=A0A836IJ17_9TRYP|nr:hypothetical protein JKF63_02692 [Porcisia hertigi]
MAMESQALSDRHPSSADTPTLARTSSFHTVPTTSADEHALGLTDLCSAPPTGVAVASVAATKTSSEFAEELRRALPCNLSVPSLDEASESWDDRRGSLERHYAALTSAAEEGGADDGCIPYDYESEMEECSQYTFSDAPYSPSTTAALAAGASPPMDATTISSTRPGTPRSPSVLALPGSLAWSREREPLTPEWCERQRRDNELHHTDEHAAWHQGMKEASSAVPSQMRYALRSLVREAACREIQSLRSQPAVSFMRMEAPQSESRTCSSMRASCMLASASSMAQRKARYIHIITQQWKSLEERLEEMMKEPVGGGISSEAHLRSVGNILNSLFLFSSDSQSIIREMNMNYVEEQRRQRRDRESQLITTLASQGRLFLLPTLYAEEVEEPEPVLQIESVLCPSESISLCTHPWQLLSPDMSLYSSSPSPTPDESIGATSPCSSGSMSTTCSPMLSSQSSSVASARLTFGRSNVWQDMKPARLPLLDLFMAAPAVVPPKAVVDSEVSMPCVMPIDPACAPHEMCRQEAITHVALGDSVFSPQLCGAMIKVDNNSVCASDEYLRPLLPDSAEGSWRSYAEEDLLDCTEAVRLGNAEMFLLSFEMDEAVTTSALVAPTRVPPTEG